MNNCSTSILLHFIRLSTVVPLVLFCVVYCTILAEVMRLSKTNNHYQEGSCFYSSLFENLNSFTRVKKDCIFSTLVYKLDEKQTFTELSHRKYKNKHFVLVFITIFASHQL